MNIFSTQQWAETHQGYHKDRVPKERRPNISYIVGEIGITIKCGQYLHILDEIDLAIKCAALSLYILGGLGITMKDSCYFCYGLVWTGTTVKGVALSVTFSADWESWWKILSIFVMISVGLESQLRVPRYFYYVIGRMRIMIKDPYYFRYGLSYVGITI